jgi:hypothetical protein
MRNAASALQRFVRYVPLAGSLVGMVLILGSIVFFFDSDAGRVVGAAGGILALLGSVWYAANPFFKSTRRYVLLRAEVVRFIGLARELNAAVVEGASAHQIASARSRLHDAVDRIVAAAGRTDVPAGASDAGAPVRPAGSAPRGP